MTEKLCFFCRKLTGTGGTFDAVAYLPPHVKRLYNTEQLAQLEMLLGSFTINFCAACYLPQRLTVVAGETAIHRYNKWYKNGANFFNLGEMLDQL